MSEDKVAHTEGQQIKPRRWQPSKRQVLWAIGMMVALVTLALLIVKIVNLYPGTWQALSREQVAILIGFGVTLLVVIVLLAIGGTSLGWTGFGNRNLWDWLQLLSALAIPVVLAVAGFWFTTQQDQRQEAIEKQRAESAQEIEEQRAQDEALQAYLDQMSTLLFKEDLRKDLRNSGAVLTVVRARTTTVIQRLDADRNQSVIRFLNEARLTVSSGGLASVGLLAGADLQGAHLESVNFATLSDVDLSHADLSHADLSDADLSDANLIEANLSNADLSGANLSNADLSGAYLRQANLRQANLKDASVVPKGNPVVPKVPTEYLEINAASLEGATMPDGTLYEQYTTREFEPALSFSLRHDWKLGGLETTDRVFIETGPKGSQLWFTNPRHALDPSRPIEEVPAPENADEWASWFQRHPHLNTSEPVPVSVGDASGKRIDVTVTSMPENFPKEACEQPCVPLYSDSDGSANASYEGWKDRFVIMNVEGEPVVINVSAPADKFEEFLPKAQRVLDSVEWKGG